MRATNATTRRVLSGMMALLLAAPAVIAHCEIPCGIYDDAARFTEMREHVATIEKSMNQISELEKGGNANQLVRWVSNKEHHANEVQHIVSQYFMTQRVKPEGRTAEPTVR